MTDGPGSGDAHYRHTCAASTKQLAPRRLRFGLAAADERNRRISTVVYHAAVQDAVAAKEHHDLVRSIPDPMWTPEYQTGEEI